MDNAIPCSAGNGAAIPSMLTDRCSIAPAQHHLNQPQVRTLSYLRPLACVNGAVSSTPSVSASVNNTAAFMLLNPYTLNNKGLLIYDIITDRKSDFLCLTETWQHQQDVFTLNQATPPGYIYIQKPCSNGHGVGLAVIHRANILVKQLPVLNVTSFECAAFSHSYQLSSSTVLQKSPPPSCLSCLSSPPSALCLHLHSCLVISTSMWTPQAAPLPQNSYTPGLLQHHTAC